MKIAYMIAAHTDPVQLGKLVKSLEGPDVDFFVHIDKKCSITPFEQSLNGLDGVNFVKKRVCTNWGGGIPVCVPKKSNGGSIVLRQTI